jgi:hypothetical protein
VLAAFELWVMRMNGATPEAIDKAASAMRKEAVVQK